MLSSVRNRDARCYTYSTLFKAAGARRVKADNLPFSSFKADSEDEDKFLCSGFGRFASCSDWLVAADSRAYVSPAICPDIFRGQKTTEQIARWMRGRVDC